MIKLARTLTIGLCATLLMFSCSKDMEDVTPTSTLSSVSVNEDVTANEIGPYTVSGLTKDGNNWSFTVQRTGIAQKNGLSHLIINLRDCNEGLINLTAANISGAAITGNGVNFNLAEETLDIAFSEGGGTGCDMTGAEGFVKFDDLDGILSDGNIYTFTLTLNDVTGVSSADVWVKAGNSCYKDEIAGDGCTEVVGCSYTQGQIKNQVDMTGVGAITIGGKSYTGAKVVEIVNSKDYKEGIKSAFAQTAALKLSIKLGKLSGVPGEIADDVKKVDEEFATLNTMSTGDISNDAKTAAGNIGEWIEANSCTVEKESRAAQVGKSKGK